MYLKTKKFEKNCKTDGERLSWTVAGPRMTWNSSDSRRIRRHHVKTVFDWESKVIEDHFGFLLLALWLVPKTSLAYLLNQSNAELMPLVTCSLAFSRALGSLPVFSIHRLILTSLVIRYCKDPRPNEIYLSFVIKKAKDWQWWRNLCVCATIDHR